MKDLTVSVNLKGIDEIEATMKKLDDAIKTVKQTAFELSRMGVAVEIDIDKWKNC